MRVHKRKKTSRIRGGKTCGYGFRQKHKGSGNKGGKGMSGSNKHKKQKALTLAKESRLNYFGKKGLTSIREKKRKEDVINLDDIKKNFFNKDNEKIDLSKYKILGRGEGFKAEIICKKASESAIQKMESAGGKIIIK